MRKAARKRETFPISIKRGSVVVRIYRLKHKGAAKGWVYDVKWYVGKTRRSKQTTCLEKAKELANLKAKQLAAGRISAAESISGDDAYLLAEAREICGATPILAALKEWRRAHEICGGALIPATEAWRARHAGNLKTISLPDAVKEFLKSKKRANVNVKSTYGRILERLAERLPGPMSAITVSVLETTVHDEFRVDGEELAKPTTYNTIRKRLVSLWRWCRKQGYLPRDSQTEAERMERAQEGPLDIGICTLKEYARVLDLISREHPRHLAVAALAGLCGLRRGEIHAQLWSDINLERKHLRVTKAKANTPSKRLVTLCDAAVEWLMRCKREGDLVSPPWGVDRVRMFSKDKGLALPENAFRHSFISYRVAKTGDVSETSLEAGNSPTTIHRHYRELVSKEEGEQWFNLTPDHVAALVRSEEVDLGLGVAAEATAIANEPQGAITPKNRL